MADSETDRDPIPPDDGLVPVAATPDAESSAITSPADAALEEPAPPDVAAGAPSYQPSISSLLWLGAFVLLGIAGYWHVASPRYRFEAGRTALEAGDFDAAQREAARLSRRPASLPFGKLLEGELLVQRADGPLDQRTMQAAEQLFQTAAEEESIRGLAFALAGRAHLAAGDARGAYQLLQNGLQFDPLQPECNRYMGLLMFTMGEYNAAAKGLSSSVQLSPRDPRPLVLLGRSYRALGQMSEAADCFRRALSLYPSEPTLERQSTREFLATCLFDMGDAAAAEAELAQCPIRTPSVEYLTARCAFAKNQTEAARSAIDAALALSPDDTDALGLKGEIEIAAGDAAAAVAAFSQVVGAFPTDPVPRQKLAEGYALLGDTVQAEEQQAKSDELKSKWDRLKELETTIREKPTEPEPILEMGRLYQELEQPEAAAGAYQMILSIDPQHAEARAALEAIGAAAPQTPPGLR
ncbi:MAG: tetratricopeptide repeat protein [Pirellulales bacterium]